MTELNDILNFVQLTDDVGTAGQPTAEQFAAIAAAGYSTVINLAMPDSDNALADEGAHVSQQGMTYIHLPIDFAAPQAKHAGQFFALMQASCRPHAKVFVHCAMNLRVSAFMYLYLRHVRGLDEQTARSPLIAKWQPHMDPVWQDFLALTAKDIAEA